MNIIHQIIKEHEEGISMKELKVFLRKKTAHTLERSSDDIWTLDGRVIDQEQAITELVEAVSDLGYWCQVAKDVLPGDQFFEVQRAYEYDPEQELGWTSNGLGRFPKEL